MGQGSEERSSSERPAEAARWGPWRRRLVIAGSILTILYGILLAVRWWRDYPSGRDRAVFRDTPRVLSFAHRGASNDADENTLAAFELAREQGATVLEIDVHLSRDGKVVVSHDHSLGRVFGDGRRISELDYSEITRVAQVANKEVPPLLDETFERFPGMRLNIELKDNSKWLAAAVADEIVRSESGERVIVVSARCSAIRKFRKFSKGRVATGACGSEAMRFAAFYHLGVAARPAYDALQIPPHIELSLLAFDFGSADFLRFAHRHGLQVHYWTVDDAAEMRRLIRNGADGIMTNMPARLRGVIEGEVLPTGD